MPKSKPPDPVTGAVPDLFAALDRDVPALPPYDPAVEITARDMSNDPARNISYDKAKRKLDQLAKDGTWSVRDVMLANGHKALAYRPKGKA